jgi:hypothetical protein
VSEERGGGNRGKKKIMGEREGSKTNSLKEIGLK